jgi:hypothetical protein
MSFRPIVRAFLRGVGVLLIVLGLAHLAATPHIPQLLSGSPPLVYDHAIGPTLLNHVLVGILLVPMGFTVFFASAAACPVTRRILLVNAAAVLALPVSIVAFMRRPEYYTAPLFLLGTLLVAAISVLTLAATLALFLGRDAADP